MRTYKPYIPKTIGELHDQLGFMFLKSPTFHDPFFPGRNLDTAFLQLNEGLHNIKSKIGKNRYSACIALSDRIRALFEVDPEDSNGSAREGRKLIREIETIILEKS